MGGASTQDNPIPFLSTLTEIVERIRNDYVDEPSITEAMRGAIRGMVERVDPNGGYLDAESVAFYSSYDPLQAPGIGVVLSKKFDYPVIVAATPGGPAALAGLGTGDTIEGIDGETLREHNLVEVYQLLSGPDGSTVELNAIRRTAAAAERVFAGGVGFHFIKFVADRLDHGAGNVELAAFPAAHGRATRDVALSCNVMKNSSLRELSIRRRPLSISSWVNSRMCCGIG